MCKCIVTLIAAMVIVATHMAHGYPSVLRDSLYNKLDSVSTAVDSLSILYNIFDCEQRKEAKELLPTIYHVAERAGDERAQFDLLRNAASMYIGNDSAQYLVLDEVESMPETLEQKSTSLFVRMCIITSQARYYTEKQRQEGILKVMNMYSEIQDFSVYDEIVMLHTLCSYLEYDSSGMLLSHYMDKLEEALRRLPFKLDGIRNMFYTQKALWSTYNGDVAGALSADRELLRLIEELRLKHAKTGRPYRHYERFYYTIYRRMLANAEGLTNDEIEDLYRKILQLAEDYPEIRADLDSDQRAHIYYLMATKRYSEALPMISQLVHSNKYSQRRKLDLIRFMKEAAIELGDREKLLEASLLNDDIMEQYVKYQDSKRYKELQVLYEVNSLKARNTMLEMQQQELELREFRIITIISCIALALLLLLVVVLYGKYKKKRKLSIKLSDVNDKLQAECDELSRVQPDLVSARDKARADMRHSVETINAMTNDLNSPLNIIASQAQMLAEIAESNPSKEVMSRCSIQLLENSEKLRVQIKRLLESLSIDEECN